MSLDKKFILIQRLKTSCKVAHTKFLHSYEPDPPTLILLAFYGKAIDLADGIIQLHKAGLDECVQALVRILFEANLKYSYYLYLLNNGDPKKAVEVVFDSLMIMKEKDAIVQQDSFNAPFYSDEFKDDLQKIKTKYSTTELNKITRNGFSQKSVSDLAKEQGKYKEYIILYKNFSRNVHANDTVEYVTKQNPTSSSNYFDKRNSVAFESAFSLFIDMMNGMNKLLDLNMDDQLNEIIDDYRKLRNSDRSGH